MSEGSSGPPARGDLAWALGLLALGGAVFLAWRQALGLAGALGTDTPLWGLTAEGMTHGAVPQVPPAWPALLAILRHLGAPLVAGGSALSLVLAAALPPATFLAARALGAARSGALVAALLTLACPDVLAWSAQLQSNSLVALALVTTTGLWASTLDRAGRWTAHPRPAVAIGLAAALTTGLLPLVRENAAVATLAVLVGAPLALRGGWRLSVVVLATWWLSPLLVGVAPGPSPLDTPWSARSGMALGDLATGSGPLPNYVGEIARAERPAYVAALRDGDLWALASWHAARSLRLASDGWLVAVAALLMVAARLRHRPALLAGLLPIATFAPALLIWTQRRHVLLALPALLAVAAVAWPSRPAAAGQDRRRRAPAVLVALLCAAAVAHWPANWGERAREQRGDTVRARTLAELAAWLCAQDPLLLGGPIQDVALYCPRPRHDPDGSTADWHTLVVVPDRQARAVVPEGWQRVGPRVADMLVFELRPDEPRPCPSGRPAPGTPYLSAGPVHATLIGCEPLPSDPTP